jgi:hypothetical protein
MTLKAYSAKFVFDHSQLEKRHKCMQYISFVQTTLALLTDIRTKSDEGTLFLGDGSMAGAPTPRLGQKGIRPVIKVLDDKCLYLLSHPLNQIKLTYIVYLTRPKTVQ